MPGILFILSLGCFIALVIGLIKPSIVIRWGEKRSRLRVLFVYGISTVFLYFLAYLFIPDDGKEEIHDYYSSIDSIDQYLARWDTLEWRTKENEFVKPSWIQTKVPNEFNFYLELHEIEGVGIQTRYIFVNGELINLEIIISSLVKDLSSFQKNWNRIKDKFIKKCYEKYGSPLTVKYPRKGQFVWKRTDLETSAILVSHTEYSLSITSHLLGPSANIFYKAIASGKLPVLR